MEADTFWRSLLAAAPTPTLLLDRACRIVAGSPGGLRLLQHHPAVFNQGGTLGFRRDEEARQFHRALAACCADAGGSDECLPAILRLNNRQGRPVLLLRLAVISADGAGDVLCSMEDLTAEVADIARLAAVMGLTPAQARTAALLAKGYSVPELAERFGLSIPTLRTHIRVAMDKLNLESQQELAVWTARIARFAGLMETPDTTRPAP